ncbi:MAG: SMP-30/gluconolactonase/LRE family protein [Bacteroidota bacterium]
MRRLKKISLLLLLLLIAFIAYTLITTGFFRTITPKFNGTILKKIALKGAEDIMISTIDSFALISATDRNGLSDDSEQKGGLYLIDFTADNYTPIPLTESFTQPFAPHGISFFKKDSTYHVMAVNHTPDGHTIEVFELKGKKCDHVKTLKHPSMISPNDLVMIDEGRFYVTNDHGYAKGIGKVMEEYMGLAVSNVVYFDGSDYKEVASGIAYANGINYDQDRNLLFVASPRHFLVKVYTLESEGPLTFIEDIPCGTGVDNIEFDAKGNLWIGCHPNLMRFNFYAKGWKQTAPSEVIKIDYRGKRDYNVEKVYVEKGDVMSASTVATPFGELIFVGNVLDDEFLVLERVL